VRGGVTVSFFTCNDNVLKLFAGGVTVSFNAILACGGVTVSCLTKVLRLFGVGVLLLFLVHATMETAIDEAIKPIVNSFFILINLMLMINTNIIKGNSGLRFNQELPLSKKN
jgi:hypothetical protein